MFYYRLITHLKKQILLSGEKLFFGVSASGAVIPVLQLVHSLLNVVRIIIL